MSDDAVVTITTEIAKAANIPVADIQNVPVVPSFLSILVHDYSQKLLTIASVWILAHGLNKVTNQPDIVNLGVGIAGIILSCVWTIAIGYIRKQKMTALLSFVPK